jgi:hypothetical protein
MMAALHLWLWVDGSGVAVAAFVRHWIKNFVIFCLFVFGFFHTSLIFGP